MKQSEIELKLIEYLNKKGINLIYEGSNLVWNYLIHYSQFKIYVNFNYNYRSVDNLYTITFNASRSISGLHRRKTSTKVGFEYRVYKTLLYIKDELDKIAERIRSEKDSKVKYCTELESYYKRIHDRVEITSVTEDDYNGIINITIYGYNGVGYNSITTYYSITYKNGKYYLIYKIETFKKVVAQAVL